MGHGQGPSSYKECQQDIATSDRRIIRHSLSMPSIVGRPPFAWTQASTGEVASNLRQSPWHSSYPMCRATTRHGLVVEDCGGMLGWYPGRHQLEMGSNFAAQLARCRCLLYFAGLPRVQRACTWQTVHSATHQQPLLRMHAREHGTWQVSQRGKKSVKRPKRGIDSAVDKQAADIHTVNSIGDKLRGRGHCCI